MSHVELFIYQIFWTVITNEPSGNFVISADIGSDGKLVRDTIWANISYLLTTSPDFEQSSLH